MQEKLIQIDKKRLDEIIAENAQYKVDIEVMGGVVKEIMTLFIDEKQEFNPKGLLTLTTTLMIPGQANSMFKKFNLEKLIPILIRLGYIKPKEDGAGNTNAIESGK